MNWASASGGAEGRLRDAICTAYQERGIAPHEWVEPAAESWPIFSRVLDILKDDGGAGPSLRGSGKTLNSPRVGDHGLAGR
jgi:hypothetical protein